MNLHKHKKGEICLVKVEVKNLTKIFGKKTQVALEMMKNHQPKTDILKKTGATVGVYDASFDVQEGEIFVIMGLSGSGKSTLIRLLNRLIEPTAGNIYIDGEDISKLSKEELREVRRHKINMVFQNFGLFPHRTILENTEYGLEVRGVPKEERQQKAEQALENSSLLSKTIIFITHDLNEALRIGDRIALMKDGEIMQIGTGEEILTNPANDYVREFVEEVDRSKVLTAQNIMVPALTTNIESDGPNVALTRMRNEEVSMLMAVDRKRNLKGIITADQALEARRQKRPLIDFLDENVTVIGKDMIVSDIFNIIYDSPTPLAVVDNGKLKGVVIRGSVIEALAESGEVNEHE